jgi:hypothetical protein
MSLKVGERKDNCLNGKKCRVKLIVERSNPAMHLVRRLNRSTIGSKPPWHTKFISFKSEGSRYVPYIGNRREQMTGCWRTLSSHF